MIFCPAAASLVCETRRTATPIQTHRSQSSHKDGDSRSNATPHSREGDQVSAKSRKYLDSRAVRRRCGTLRCWQPKVELPEIIGSPAVMANSANPLAVMLHDIKLRDTHTHPLTTY